MPGRPRRPCYARPADPCLMARHFISNAQVLVDFFAWRCDDMEMGLYENRAAQPGVAIFLNVFVFLRPVLASLRVVLEPSHVVLASSQFVFALQQVVAPSQEVAVAVAWLHVVGAPLEVVLLSCHRRRSLGFIISLLSLLAESQKCCRTPGSDEVVMQFDSLSRWERVGVRA